VKDIREVLDKTKSLESYKRKKIVSGENKNIADIVKMLEELKNRLKGCRRYEKKEALKNINSVIAEIEENNTLHNALSALGKGGSITYLNAYGDVLLLQKEYMRDVLDREIKKYEKKDTLFDADRFFETWVKKEFEKRLGFFKERGIGLADKIIMLYEIWYSQGEKNPPALSFIRELIKNETVEMLMEKLNKKSKNFDDISFYERDKIIKSLVKDETEKMDEAEKRLLRVIANTPDFYWRKFVPEEAKRHISVCYGRGKFGLEALKSGKRMEIDYAGDGSSEDWFLNVKEEELVRGDTGFLYPHRDLAGEYVIEQVSRFSGDSISSLEKEWKKNKKVVFAKYHSYQRARILKNYVWRREKQVYSIEWTDKGDNKHEDKWMLIKDSLRDNPVFFREYENVEGIKHINKNRVLETHL
jgi:hypothetical protein